MQHQIVGSHRHNGDVREYQNASSVLARSHTESQNDALEGFRCEDVDKSWYGKVALIFAGSVCGKANLSTLATHLRQNVVQKGDDRACISFHPNNSVSVVNVQVLKDVCSTNCAGVCICTHHYKIVFWGMVAGHCAHTHTNDHCYCDGFACDSSEGLRDLHSRRLAHICA